MEKSTQENHRIIRMGELTKKVGYAPSTIYDLITKDKFPKPFKLIEGGRASGWLESTIDAYLEKQSGEIK